MTARATVNDTAIGQGGTSARAGVPQAPDRLSGLLARAVQQRRPNDVGLGMRGPLLQRVLEPKGRWEGNRGPKDLWMETDDGKYYFKAYGSDLWTWVLAEVTITGDKYVIASGTRRVPAPKPTKRDWQALTSFNQDGTMMFYNRNGGKSYPHVTIDVVPAAKELTDTVDFATMHYSRSDDDPYRSGYARSTPGQWKPVNANREADKQKECDDAVDAFFKAAKMPDRVVRATTRIADEPAWARNTGTADTRRSDTAERWTRNAGTGGRSSGQGGTATKPWSRGAGTGSHSSGQGGGGARPWHSK